MKKISRHDVLRFFCFKIVLFMIIKQFVFYLPLSNYGKLKLNESKLLNG